MLGVFVAIVLACLAAPVYAHDVAHTDPFRSNLNGTTIANGKTGPGRGGVDQRARPRHDSDRPDVGSAPLLPRRRPAGTGCGRAAPVRRAQLAADRVLRGADRVPGGHDDRHRRRFLRRRCRRRSSRECSTMVWAFPVYLFAICLSTILLTQEFVVGPVPARGGEPRASDRDHRRRLHPVRRAPGPRRGALAAAARVRRGRYRPRRVEDRACSARRFSRTSSRR